MVSDVGTPPCSGQILILFVSRDFGTAYATSYGQACAGICGRTFVAETL